jgi:hypothetical protein
MLAGADWWPSSRVLMQSQVGVRVVHHDRYG